LADYSFKDFLFIDTLWLCGLVLGIVIPMAASGFLLTVCIDMSKEFCNEIKRQFEQIPYLLEGKAKPDIIKFTDKLIRLAMDGLIFPGILMALIPILIGYLIDLSSLISLALGTLFLTITLGFSWSNAGDVIENAKLYIDNGRFGGKENKHYLHITQIQTNASVYKDILSPSLSIFAKSVISLTAVIMIFLT